MRIKILKMNANFLFQAVYGRIVKRLLGPHVRALVVETASGVFAVDPEDNGVGGRLRRHGTYGQEELDLIYSLTGPESRVLVVGAHVGTFVVPIALRCTSVTAVEANPDTRRLLEMNLILNAVPNCEVVGFAVSDRAETIRFHLARNNSGNSKRSPRNRMFWDYYDQPRVIEVQAARLDDLLPGRGFDLIVMDVEGSEYLALKGMPEILGKSKALVVEFMPLMIRSMSDVTVDAFVGVIEPYFSTLFVPTLGLTVEREKFREVLGAMFERNHVDPGLLFRKA